MPAPGYINPKPRGRRITESVSSFPGLPFGVKILLFKILTNPKQKKAMMDKLKSRKLWAAVLGSLIVSLGDQLGLTPEATQWVATIVTGYVIGQGIADLNGK